MNKQLNAVIVAIACLLMLPVIAFAQLPQPTYGWNLGNTMETPGAEGSWNNPPVTQDVINTVAAAGFNTIRIPLALNSHANQQTLEIDPAWLDRIQEVVDWCLAQNLHVVINSHWDEGWLDNDDFSRFKQSIDDRVHSYWTQLSETFKDYDDRLLFAATNEPGANTAAKWEILMMYYQTFVDAVRATGGGNTDRWLALSGPWTNIELTVEHFTELPNDPTPGRIMAEVHYYDPFNFTLMSQDESWGNMAYFWGEGYHTTVPELLIRNSTWGEEAHMAEQLQMMYDNFVSQGIPVLLGEFAASKRVEHEALEAHPVEMERHLASRTYFNKQMVDLSNSMGISPIYWDAGWAGKDGSALIDRVTAQVIDPDGVTALTGGPAVPPPSPCVAGSMSVSSISVTSVNVGQGNRVGRANVTIVDDCGNPVSGATVTGDFTGTFNESGKIGVTNSSGVAALQTDGTSKGKVSITFCVTDVAQGGLSYNPSDNVVTCNNN